MRLHHQAKIAPATTQLAGNSLVEAACLEAGLSPFDQAMFSSRLYVVREPGQSDEVRILVLTEKPQFIPAINRGELEDSFEPEKAEQLAALQNLLDTFSIQGTPYREPHAHPEAPDTVIYPISTVEFEDLSRFGHAVSLSGYFPVAGGAPGEVAYRYLLRSLCEKGAVETVACVSTVTKHTSPRLEIVPPRDRLEVNCYYTHVNGKDLHVRLVEKSWENGDILERHHAAMATLMKHDVEAAERFLHAASNYVGK